MKSGIQPGSLISFILIGNFLSLVFFFFFLNVIFVVLPWGAISVTMPGAMISVFHVGSATYIIMVGRMVPTTCLRSRYPPLPGDMNDFILPEITILSACLGVHNLLSCVAVHSPSFFL